MNTYIALLRGINLGSHNQIRMPALVGLFEALGYDHVRSYLQSGNIIFAHPKADETTMPSVISTEIEKKFGLSLPVIIRTGEGLRTILTNNPFINEKKLDSAGLYVTFLQYIPESAVAAQLQAPSGDPLDEFVIGGKEIYVSCPNGYGRTKLNNTFFERKLKTPATTRNWNTVTALYEMSRER